MSKRLYVGNLAYSTTEEALRAKFSAHGNVTSVTIIQGKGFGFVEFDSESAAQAAKAALNQTEIDGRTIRVDEARAREERPQSHSGGGQRRFR
jgi:RNA recognition motif-containing protein